MSVSIQDFTKILYVFSENKGDINYLKVSLSSKFKIETVIKRDVNGNIYKIIIKINKNDNYIENFFSRTGLLELTGIIGENGTGKSAVLSEIENLFSTKIITNIEGSEVEIADKYLKFIIVENIKTDVSGVNSCTYNLVINNKSLSHILN